MAKDSIIYLRKQNKRRDRLPRIEVVDLFCGIGGLSYGMNCLLSLLDGYGVCPLEGVYHI